MPPTAIDFIRQLELKPHPEGGHYRETFRDAAVDAGGRAASTAIYFLLERGVVSRWHRIDAVEVWHWYAGAPFALSIRSSPTTALVLTIVGNDILAGQQPQAVIQANTWQQARSLGDRTLVGCTVAPGFLFDRFEIAPDASAAVAAIR